MAGFLFERAIQVQELPKYLSTGNDPLYRRVCHSNTLNILSAVQLSGTHSGGKK